MEENSKRNRLFQWLPIIGLLFFFGLALYGRHVGIFDSAQSLQAFIGRFGNYAVLVFILLQLIQVVIPILPGGISTVAGMVMFGPLFGVIYSYIGLVIGEIIGFLLIRKYGIEVAKLFLTAKKFNQFQKILDNNQKTIKRFLVITLLIPFAPDDIVCLVAGLTTISFKDFLKIILFFKPWSIAIYGLLMLYLFQQIEGLL